MPCVNQTSFHALGHHVTLHLNKILRPRSLDTCGVGDPWAKFWTGLEPCQPCTQNCPEVEDTPLTTRSAGAVVIRNNLALLPLAVVHDLTPPPARSNLGPQWALPATKVQLLPFHSSVMLCTPRWKMMAFLVSGEGYLSLESVDD